MAEMQTIQWFPGHMTKTRRMMEKHLKLVDIVIELTDARIPYSSRNPEIDKLLEGKPRLLLLNKCDTSDESINQKWCNYYKSKGIIALPTDCRSGRGLNKFTPTVKEILAPQLERLEAKGMGGRSIRMMIVGIPNVGKSSFINRMAGARLAKVEDRPGVTRGKQWAKLESGAELLDMPGVLWPKFDDLEVGEHLAFTGAIKDDVIDTEQLAMQLLEILAKNYMELLSKRYNFTAEEAENLDGYDLLELVGKKRGMLIAGGGINTERAAIAVLDEFRSGAIGNISLEKPEDYINPRPKKALTEHDIKKERKLRKAIKNQNKREERASKEAEGQPKKYYGNGTAGGYRGTGKGGKPYSKDTRSTRNGSNKPSSPSAKSGYTTPSNSSTNSGARSTGRSTSPSKTTGGRTGGKSKGKPN